MPITFMQVAATGDPLSVHSYQLDFPTLPNGVDGTSLTYRNASVSLPEIAVGQITVKPFGWSVSFAGRRLQTPSFPIEFIDTTDSPVYKILTSWQRLAAGYKNSGAKSKADYAVNARCIDYDTVGKKALVNTLYNIWPIRFKHWDSAEEAGAAHVTCEFSIDGMDVVNMGSYDSFEETLVASYTFSP